MIISLTLTDSQEQLLQFIDQQIKELNSHLTSGGITEQYADVLNTHIILYQRVREELESSYQIKNVFTKLTGKK